MSSVYALLESVEHQLSPSFRKALKLAEGSVGVIVKELAAAMAEQGATLVLQWLEQWAAQGKTVLAPTGTLTAEDELTVLRRQAYDAAKAVHPDIRDAVINSAIELAILGAKGYGSPMVGAPPAPAELPPMNPNRAPIVGPEDRGLFR